MLNIVLYVMTKEYVTERVIDVISYSTRTDRKTITTNTNLFADIGIDSLDFMDIVVELEKVLNVDLSNLPNPMINETSTIGELSNEVYKHLNNNVAIQ